MQDFEPTEEQLRQARGTLSQADAVPFIRRRNQRDALQGMIDGWREYDRDEVVAILVSVLETLGVREG